MKDPTKLSISVFLRESYRSPFPPDSCRHNHAMDATASPNLFKVPQLRLHGRHRLPTGKLPVRRHCSSSSPPAYATAAPISATSAADCPEGQSNCMRGRPPMAALFDALEDTITRYLEPFPLQSSVDPEHVLAGNYAPVEELPPTSCRVVKGRIPSCLLGGAYVRIGPNPLHQPRSPYHLFDGDGMLHSLLLPEEDTGDGSQVAAFCSRYVRTQTHAVESTAGAPVLPNFFALRGVAGLARAAVSVMRAIAGQIDLWNGVTPTNTSLFLFHDRLLAIGEANFPYDVHLSPVDGDISTVGRWKIDNKVFGGMAAHPKKDPDTGEVFALRYGFLPPFLSYFWFDRDGKKQPDVPINSVPRLSIFHDFAITDKYAVFAESQMVMDPLGMAMGGGRPMFRFDPAKVPRVGLLPKRARPGDKVTWVDVPGFNPLHVVNAWEEGDAVVLVAPNWFNMEHLVDRMELAYGHMEMVRVDFKMRVATRTPLSVRNLDFATINPAYLGRKCRYAYLVLGDDTSVKVKGVAKLDLELAAERRECVVACREYGPDCFGGESFFVAKEEGREGDEDDGYLVTYVHDESKRESRLVVMDAKSPELDVVAEVALPRRVPYGFHGIFLRQCELRGQRLHGH